ncbi:hypothetical protein Tco_0643629 [Tanacetum coccineum]
MKRRARRVRRSVSKKYNKNRVVTKIKPSAPPSTSNESTLKRLNKEARDDQRFVSNEICMNNNDITVDHWIYGFKWIIEHNDKEDEILSLSASHSLGFCSYKDHKEIGFDDDLMLWLWEDDNLELHHRY